MKWGLTAVAAMSMIASLGPAMAGKNYGPGVTDSEIRIGQTFAYSGPASAYSVIPRAQIAYFRMINEKGGINGRKVSLISLDDAYSPPKTFEQTRKLVEQENVSFIFSPLGTPTGMVVRKYLNDRKIPQLFVGGGATAWGDPKHFPWSMSFQPSYQAETAVYAAYVLKHKPDAKIALLYQNDDAGKDYAYGFKKGLGPDNVKKMVVSEATYEPTDPSIDSQILKLRASGADVLFMHAIPKQAAQGIRKIHEIGWKPTFFLAATSASVSMVLQPAGLEASKDIITAQYVKDPTDPQWKDDPETKDWLAFMAKYYPDGNLQDSGNVYGYVVAAATARLLEQAGDDLTRENIMKQAANMDFRIPMLLPGIKLQTTPTDYYPLKSLQLQRFNGKTWVLFGEIITP